MSTHSTAKPPQSSLKLERDLATQYGGIHSAKWIDHLPASWIPYIQLARLSPPIAISLIYFPQLFGLLHAAILLGPQISPLTLLSSSIALLLFTFFFSNAAHAWNDLVDSPIDKITSRTKNRPIPRGAISPRDALLFSLSQFIAAAAVLYYLTPAENTLFYFIPYVVATLYYPYAKRHTHFVQFVLGLTLAWGVIIGSSALSADLKPLTVYGYPPSDDGSKSNAFQSSIILLFLASAAWSVIYDTIYAHQDLQDDLVNGVKSLAVLFREWTKGLLWVLLAGMIVALVGSGQTAGLGWGFSGIAGGGSMLALGAMINGVDLKDSGSCWWWFAYGYWITGLSITGGLGLEYARRLLI